MIEIFSSGGVGDALIVGLKIQQGFEAEERRIVWRHFEKHECHGDACLDIQQQFADHSECFIMEQPHNNMLEMCDSVGGIYIDTKMGEVLSPYLKKPLARGSFFHEKLLGESDYIVVQAQAGRMNDNTRREVSLDVMNGLLQLFPDKKIVILGPESHPFHTVDMSRTINLTGATESVIDALEIINDACLFIGQDGIMAYYSLMLKKPTILAFHIHTLPEHYWNERWGSHAVALLGAGNILSQLPLNDKIERLLVNV